MAKSRFRIIAIRPITPRNIKEDDLELVKSIQKKVFGSSWLYFYRGYKLVDVINNTINSEENSEPFYGQLLTVDDYVCDDSILYDQNDVCISIGAIVGPNGCGKSSTIELMVRILNNLSVAAKGETFNHSAAEHLFFIENVYGILIIQEGDTFFQIKVAGRSVCVSVYQRNNNDNNYFCGKPLELLSAEAKTNKFIPIEGSGIGMTQLYKMFYTAIFNYSMYAFNYKDYYNERTMENRWNNIKKGNNSNEYFKEEFDENQVWLKGLFHKNDGYQTPIVLNPMRDKGIINVPKENHLTNERLLNELFYANHKRKGYAGQPMFPFRVINDHLEIIALKIKNKINPKFSKENIISTLGFKGNALTRDFNNIREQVCKLWSKAYCMAYCNSTQHENLAWDYVVYKTLKIIKTYDKYNKLRRDLLYFEKFNKDKVYKHFCNILQDKSHVTLKLRQALTFLKYRIFRENYDHIISLRDAYSNYEKICDFFISMNLKIDKESGQLVGEIPDGHSLDDIPKVKFKDSKLKVEIPETDVHAIPLFFVDKNGVLIVKMPDHEEAILPPIFDIEPMLIEKSLIKEDYSFNVNELIPMSGLSSGEKQIAGSISNMVYHIANINSVWQDNNEIKLTQYQSSKRKDEVQQLPLLKYKYINIVFDEVELYFHPDLQRRFVKGILDALRNLHLEYIQGINIMLVTHSPFVLSDLPRTNVLALNNEQSDIEETFCANIHEMLGSSFFMTYSMGDLARDQVENIFCVYRRFKNGEKNISKLLEENWTKYQYVASKVADEYLSKLIKGMLEEMESLINADIVLDMQIQETENRLKELKAKREAKI